MIPDVEQIVGRRKGRHAPLQEPGEHGRVTAIHTRHFLNRSQAVLLDEKSGGPALFCVELHDDVDVVG